MNNSITTVEVQNDQNVSENGNLILFEGRLLEKSQLSWPWRKGKKIYAHYRGFATLHAEYNFQGLAVYGLRHLKQKLNGGPS